jgi:hypothetical protein
MYNQLQHNKIRHVAIRFIYVFLVNLMKDQIIYKKHSLDSCVFNGNELHLLDVKNWDCVCRPTLDCQSFKVYRSLSGQVA